MFSCQRPRPQCIQSDKAVVTTRRERESEGRRTCKDATPLETLPIVEDPSFELEAGEGEREIERARRMESEKDGERNRGREKVFLKHRKNYFALARTKNS